MLYAFCHCCIHSDIIAWLGGHGLNARLEENLYPINFLSKPIRVLIYATNTLHKSDYYCLQLMLVKDDAPSTSARVMNSLCCDALTVFYFG